MESNKHLIIQLIIHDMKNEQLLEGLYRLGFRSEIHYSDLLGVISELMGTPEIEISWDWFDVYMDFMKQARQFGITGDGKNLLPLAESCYNSLQVNTEQLRVQGNISK